VKSRVELVSAALTTALTATFIGGGIACAPAASAGCEGPPLAQVCDKPVNPDGSWQRCMTAYGGPVYGNPVGSYFPNTWKCFNIHPQQVPLAPAGQPQYHIDDP
jgi:hypothetical protein